MPTRAFFPVSKFQTWAEHKAKRATLFKTLGSNYLVAFIRCTLGSCNGCTKSSKACNSCPLDKLSEQAESTVKEMRIDARKTITKGELIYREKNG